MNHYTYMITKIADFRQYIGVRSSKMFPEKDLGIEYFSTSSDEAFIQDQKNNPHEFLYDILGIFDTRKEAMAHEIQLHKHYDVGKNNSFYNGCRATSTGFSTLGTKHPSPNGEGLNNSNARPKIVYLWDGSILKCDGNITTFYKNVNRNAVIKIEDYINQKYHSLYKGEKIKIYDYIPSHNFLRKPHNIIETPNDGIFYYYGGIENFKDKIKNSRSNQIKYKIENGYPIHLNINKKIPVSFTLDNIKCPHCEQIGTPRQMTRYHFDNCKRKK